MPNETMRRVGIACMALLFVVTASAGCENVEKALGRVAEDLDIGEGREVMENHNREHLKWLEREGYPELERDYATVFEAMRTTDRDLSEFNELRRCVVKLTYAIQELRDYESDRIPSGLLSCDKDCPAAADKHEGTLQTIAERNGEKCNALREKFVKGLYRESLEGFSKAIREDEAPFMADQYRLQLGALKHELEKQFGQDDPLAKTYRKRLEELESGETGEKLDAYDRFEARHADQLERIVELIEKERRLADQIRSARLDRVIDAKQRKLYETEKKRKQLVGEFARAAKEAGMVDSVGQVDMVLRFHVGDTDGWKRKSVDSTHVRQKWTILHFDLEGTGGTDAEK